MAIEAKDPQLQDVEEDGEEYINEFPEDDEIQTGEEMEQMMHGDATVSGVIMFSISMAVLAAAYYFIWMGKDGGFLTAKAIGKRIKAKGLQRLRWYCQACEKQCRDANGFKCHCDSEAHNRQIQLLASNAKGAIDAFSAQFEKEFMRLGQISQKYRSTKVAANVAYNEFIADRNHTHMNATMWTTLSDFVKYLGREGRVTVEEGDKGWYIRYIDREALARNEAHAKKEKMDVDDEERNRRLVEMQKERAREAFAVAGIDDRQQEAVELRKAEGEVIGFAVQAKAVPVAKVKAGAQVASSLFEEEDEEEEKAGGKGGGKLLGKKRQAVEELREEQERKKRRLGETQLQQQKQKERQVKDKEEKREKAGKGVTKDYWLVRDIVVRVTDKKVGGGKYRDKKAEVVRVVDRYGGQVRMLDSGDVLILDQQALETVVPNVNGKVVVVNGRHRKKLAKVVALDLKRSTVDLRMAEGDKEEVAGVPFDHVSKLHVPKKAKKART